MKIEQKFSLWFFMLCALVCAGVPAFAEDSSDSQQTEESDESASSAEDVEAEVGVEPEDDGERDILTVGARFDALFGMGDLSQQGFSLPSFRITAYGDVSRNVGYRVSLGQTREYSSLLLTQVLPIEAYADISTDRSGGVPLFTWRLGMFRPMINSWFSPDLGDLELPEYSHLHKILLIANDLGTEFRYRDTARALEVSLGAVNGTGIYAANTNNAKGFTGLAKYGLLKGWTNLAVSVGGFFFTQSSETSISYAQNWIVNPGLELAIPAWGLVVDIEGFIGRFVDSSGITIPQGGMASGSLRLTNEIALFARAEYLRNSPVAPKTSEHIRFQAGPTYHFQNAIRAFLLYQYEEPGDGSVASSGLVRVRLAL